jgi:hypothetical protein
MGSKSFIQNEYDEIEFKQAKKEDLWYLVHTSDCLSCGNYPKSMRSTVKGFMSLFNL